MYKLNRLSPQLLISFFAVLVALAMIVFRLFNSDFMTYLDLQCYDLFLKNFHCTVQSDIPVIIDIDEKSLENHGQWPWPRYKLASLLNIIHESEPFAVGLDILFSEPDRTSPFILQTNIKKELGIEVQFSGLPDQYMDHDQMMADALQGTPTAMGIFCDFNEAPDKGSGVNFKKKLPEMNIQPVYFLYSSHYHNPSKQIAIKDRAQNKKEQSTPKNRRWAQKKSIFEEITVSEPVLKRIFCAKGLIAPIRILSESAGNLGFLNSMPDLDGVFRSTPMVIEHNGVIYPSLSLALLQIFFKNPITALTLGSGGIESILLGPMKIPVDEYGKLWMHFRGSEQSYPTYCAADVLDGKIHMDSLKNKIVLIGSSANALMDTHTSPFESEFMGVALHATAIDTVLSRDFIKIPGWSLAVEVLIFFVSGGLLLFILIRKNIILTMVLTGTMATGIFVSAALCFWKWQIFISPVFPVGALVVVFFVLTLIKFLSAEKDKAFLKQAFSKYISKSIVDEIVLSPSTLKLQGEEKEISILFVDIRNFTSLSEKLSPEQVTQLLQEFFTPMTHVITRNKGTLDKFIGDGIMAFWNAPLDIKDHKTCAFKSGVEMLKALGNLNREFTKKYGFEINIGIGLHSGIVRVGNMGTEDLFNYTIIGDDVNVTSRLENLTKFYGVRIILSEEMKAHVPHTHSVQELDLVRVQGRAQPLKIYGLYSGGFLKYPDEHLKRYHKALDCYRKHRFDMAYNLFSEFTEKEYDRPLYRLYLKRCAFFRKYPPDDDWDGVFVHNNK